MAQTRRTGIRNERAQLAKAPRFFALPIGTVWVAQRFYRSAYRQLSHKLTDCL